MNHVPLHTSPSRRGPSQQSAAALGAIGVAVAVVLVTAPLYGWSPLVRLQAVLAPAFGLALLVLRPWRWPPERWAALTSRYPSRRAVMVAGLVAAVTLYWVVLTAFRSGQINAIDFTVYFDRPAFQTLHGRPLLVESTDVAAFANRTALAIHAYWTMLPLAGLYAIRATPQWLLALSVVAVVAGSVQRTAHRTAPSVGRASRLRYSLCVPAERQHRAHARLRLPLRSAVRVVRTVDAGRRVAAQARVVPGRHARVRLREGGRRHAHLRGLRCPGSRKWLDDDMARARRVPDRAAGDRSRQLRCVPIAGWYRL